MLNFNNALFLGSDTISGQLNIVPDSLTNEETQYSFQSPLNLSYVWEEDIKTQTIRVMTSQKLNKVYTINHIDLIPFDQYGNYWFALLNLTKFLEPTVYDAVVIAPKELSSEALICMPYNDE